ncbi:MAG: hypothetical protein JOZ69_22615 [Myxococcales bacterium]|nr:hypothetical protein [Myxococcales bacterium]
MSQAPHPSSALDHPLLTRDSSAPRGGGAAEDRAPASRPVYWRRDIPDVGRLSSDGVLRLYPHCAVACGHHLIEGAEIDAAACAARAHVREVAQQAADELGMAVAVTGSWDGRHLWTVHILVPRT